MSELPMNFPTVAVDESFPSRQQQRAASRALLKAQKKEAASRLEFMRHMARKEKKGKL